MSKPFSDKIVTTCKKLECVTIYTTACLTTNVFPDQLIWLFKNLAEEMIENEKPLSLPITLLKTDIPDKLTFHLGPLSHKREVELENQDLGIVDVAFQSQHFKTKDVLSVVLSDRQDTSGFEYFGKNCSS